MRGEALGIVEADAGGVKAAQGAFGGLVAGDDQDIQVIQALQLLVGAQADDRPQRQALLVDAAFRAERAGLPFAVSAQPLVAEAVGVGLAEPQGAQLASVIDLVAELQQADLFPAGRAPLVVCNPPWVPARPSSSIEYAVYDPDSRMLRGFLAGLAEHLTDDGEGWLILSDLAEHLGLRPREQLLGWITEAGLKVLDRHDVRPVHPRASDASDPLHAARAAEVTSLWRLAAA